MVIVEGFEVESILQDFWKARNYRKAFTNNGQKQVGEELGSKSPPFIPKSFYVFDFIHLIKPMTATEERSHPIFVASEQGLDVSV